MKVLLIRHGAAEDYDAFARTGQSDDKRPLTAEGSAQMREVAHGLKTVVKEIAVIGTSPLVRAQQTAELVGEAFPDAMREVIEAMVPGEPFDAFLEWLETKRQNKWVAAVGHEPHISALASWLLGAPQPVLEMKKGSALLIEFDDELRAGRGQLRWFMTPAQLRALTTIGIAILCTACATPRTSPERDAALPHDSSTAVPTPVIRYACSEKALRTPVVDVLMPASLIAAGARLDATSYRRGFSSSEFVTLDPIASGTKARAPQHARFAGSVSSLRLTVQATRIAADTTVVRVEPLAARIDYAWRIVVPRNGQLIASLSTLAMVPPCIAD